MSALVDAAVNLVFPPLCRSCGDLLSGRLDEILCPRCRIRLHLHPLPVCSQCGAPVEPDSDSPDPSGEVEGCPHCPLFPPEFDQCRSAVSYESPFRELIHEFKFRGSLKVRPILLDAFLKGAEKFLDSKDFDCIVPVPLHWWRRFQREFNQSEVLGEALAGHWKIPLEPNALVRTRSTLPQSKLQGRWRFRRRDLEKAFTQGKTDLRGRKILLVDDVMTTGATLSACSAVLKRSGVQSVTGYTLARRLV